MRAGCEDLEGPEQGAGVQGRQPTPQPCLAQGRPSRSVGMFLSTIGPQGAIPLSSLSATAERVIQLRVSSFPNQLGN